jgi:hypothetical protein
MYMLIFLSDNAKLHIDYVTTKEVTAVEWTRCIRIGRKWKLRAFENACCIVHVKDNLLDRASLKAIAHNWAPRLRSPALVLSTLGCSSTYNNTLHVFQRTSLCPTPPKADPGCRLLRSMFIISGVPFQHKLSDSIH